RSHKLDPKALRLVQSYGSFLSRQGNTVDALKVLAAFGEVLPRHPLIVEATNELKAGKKLPLMVDTPQAGAAEVLYGLGYGPKPDGTYVVEFKTADDEALAISVPAGETRVLKYFQERMPYGLFVSDIP